MDSAGGGSDSAACFTLLNMGIEDAENGESHEFR